MKTVTKKETEIDRRVTVTAHGSKEDQLSITRSTKSQVMSVGSVGGNAGRQSMQWRTNGKGGFKVPKYQNSYRLEPHVPFRCEVSDTILTKMMTKALADVRYDTQMCPLICRKLAAEVRSHLYKTDFDRVKYLVSITIMEKADQSIYVTTGSLWDSKRDTYSTFVFENVTLYAIGTVFAVNYE